MPDQAIPAAEPISPMTDDQQPNDPAPAGDSEPAATPGPEQDETEEPAPESPELEGEGTEDSAAEADQEAPEAPAPEEPEAGPDAAEEAEPEEQPAAPEEEAEAPRLGPFDGLDAGLAWFGEQPFEPPVPAGYLPAFEAAEGEEAGAAPAGGLAQRRLRIRERLDARRKETDAQKKWYQKIPIAAYVPVPATLFIIIWILFVAKPWDRVPEPGSSQKLDIALLTAAPVEDQAAGVKAMGLDQWIPVGAWRLQDGGILMMDGIKKSAQLTFAVPVGSSRLEVSCQVCVVEGMDDHSVQLRFDEMRAVGLVGDEQRPGDAYVGARRTKDAKVVEWQQFMPIKYGHWYTLGMKIDGDDLRYYVNGYCLPPTTSSPLAASKVMLTIANARVAVRDWQVRKLD